MFVVPENVTGFKEPKEKVLAVIQPHFSMDLSDRLTLKADVNQFNHLEDPFVYQQARKGLSKYFEVYYDGVWICDFDDSYSKSRLEAAFFQGFHDAYEQDKISMDERVEEVEYETNDKSRKIEKMPDSTPEEAIVKQAVKELHEESVEEKEKRVKLVKGKL